MKFNCITLQTFSWLLQNAVLVIASLTFVTSLIEMLTFPANETLDVIHKVILAMTNTAWIFASISAFASVNYRNHYLLFPLYAMLAVSTVALPLIIVLCYVSLLVIDDPYRNESAVKEWVYRMVVAMFSLPFSVWFMLVTFTKILALITLTCALLVFFDRTTFSTSNHEKQSDAASAKSFFEILGCLLWIAASLCALLAIRFDKLSCVVPFYVMSVISTAVSMLACAASIFILAIPPKHLIGDSTKESAVTCLLASLFTTPLSVYFTICVRRCYQDFKIHCSRRKTECENGYE
ncbi:hypothetical protein QR680_010278 [Steinernema hermaphroditum]|uniref:Uncharacterized protein n=1 Tax=Steinernema hermaphroditum TaxID=289476 RepID=A0AA39MAY4_9BILA|nr:hypothetical protein QR680_010278 [Steinernema hermaphroditum]